MAFTTWKNLSHAVNTFKAEVINTSCSVLIRPLQGQFKHNIHISDLCKGNLSTIFTFLWFCWWFWHLQKPRGEQNISMVFSSSGGHALSVNKSTLWHTEQQNTEFFTWTWSHSGKCWFLTTMCDEAMDQNKSSWSLQSWDPDLTIVWTVSCKEKSQRLIYMGPRVRTISVMSSLELTGHTHQMVKQDENIELAGQASSG
jgi:hypothetical protein